MKIQLTPWQYKEFKTTTRCPECAAVLYIGDIEQHVTRCKLLTTLLDTKAGH